VITMSRTIQVTFDCADPQTLSRFWAAVLGYDNPGPPGYDASAGQDVFEAWHAFLGRVGVPENEWNSRSAAEDPEGTGPRLFFQRVPEGKIVKNRVHLDLDVGGGRGVPLEERRQRVIAEAERLAAEGATRLRVLETEGMDHFGIVMQDPEGNEFCLT
jgi:hypothetical protein